MSGRYSIEMYDQPPEFVDIVLDGVCVASWAVCESFANAIRQLLADNAALTSELSTKSHALAAERADHDRVIAERDQLRAFKAAVDSAPVVAFGIVGGQSVELITKPAKD